MLEDIHTLQINEFSDDMETEYSQESLTSIYKVFITFLEKFIFFSLALSALNVPRNTIKGSIQNMNHIA